MRPEWVDMTEILRRVQFGIYDHGEYEKALAWVKENCPEGFGKLPGGLRQEPPGFKAHAGAESGGMGICRKNDAHHPRYLSGKPEARGA